MRTLRWDDGTKWDDINAYWGDPAHVLEPGDPGYRIPPPEPGTASENKHPRKTMSSNATPQNRVILTALGGKMKAGEVAHGATVGLHHHTAATMDARIKALAGDSAAAPGSAANKGSQLIYRMAVEASGDAVEARNTLSDTTVKTWLEGYRGVLIGIHGKRSNDGWVAAGFGTGTTSVPRSPAARLTLLMAARAYLAAHATYEVTLPQPGGATLAITAAQALALQNALQTAEDAIGTCESLQAATKTTRDADVEALYEEVSATIAELSDLLADDDPRWELFGLNIPANPTPPEGVAELAVTAAGVGRELLAWPYAARAETYRVYLKRVGIDADFVVVATVRDLEYVLKNLDPGTTIEAYVAPVNEAGEGPASPTVSKVVGA